MLFKKEFLSKHEKQIIVKAITEAEDMTSGEIRVHIEAKCEVDVLTRATEMFYQLGMDKTTHANGVLVYVAYEHKKFAILGDKGINAVVPENFWDDIKNEMAAHFKRGEYYHGIVLAIKHTGSHLKQYFPHVRDQINELPNEISEG